MARTSPRPARVGAAIRDVIATYLVTAAHDPRLSSVVITEVAMTADLRIAKVYYHLLDPSGRPLRARPDGLAGAPVEGPGDPKQAAGDALQGAAGRLKAAVRDQVRLRCVPELRFYHDDTLDAARRIDELLHGLEIPDEGDPADDDGARAQ